MVLLAKGSSVLDKLGNQLDDNLFDDSAGYEDDRGIQFTPGLSEADRKQARALYKLFNALWGLCVVKGDPGAGKDTFLNWLLFTCKRYFPTKRILRDEKPRNLFGPYAGLFNEERLHEDLKRMREIARGEGGKPTFDNNYLGALERAADEWVGSDGAKVLLQHSIVGLTEYWKYVYNREPHNPMNKTMGGIHKVGRHLDTLVVGCVQLETDLDRKTCKPFINWRVTCTRDRKDSTKYEFIVDRVKYDRRLDLLIPIRRPVLIPVDAGKPRSFIGDGKIIIRKPDYQPRNEEEQIVLDALRTGFDDYDTLVALLENGGMSEQETLATLKELCLWFPDRRPKLAIWYPCYYFIFNSRSAPNITTRVKVGD